MRAKWLHHTCRFGGSHCLARGKKLEMAKWPTCEQRGDITPAILGVPNAQRGDKNQKRLCGPHAGKLNISPPSSRQAPMLSARTKIRNGYVVPMWAKWLYHFYPVGGPKRSAQGQKIEMAKWSTCMQSGSSTRAVLEVPNAQRGDNNQKWLCGPDVIKGATLPLSSWGSTTLSGGTKIKNGYVAHMRAKWLHHTCRFGGPECLA